MVIKYENGKIYKIIGPIVNEPCYVGSTTKPYLSQRMAKHSECYRAWVKSTNKNKGKIMSFELFDKYGVENCKIILLETVKATSKDELRIKEQEYINKLNCVNKYRAFLTQEERIQCRKQFELKNKDTLKTYKNQYYLANKDKNSEKIKKYLEANSEIIKARNKKYRLKNVERLRAKQQLKYYCPCCNYELCIIKRNRHNRTKLHITNTLKYMKSITEQYNQVQPVEIHHFTLE